MPFAYTGSPPLPVCAAACHVKRPTSLTYRDAGVDIDAGNELVRRIAPLAARTRRPEMLGGIGGFAALSRLPERYREPVLVAGTDGVGTKLRLAIDHDRHDHVGQDLVAMCVNDALVVGAEPLLFLDYLATAHLDVDVAERVIGGIAAACEACGCTLAGGETAEMPGMYHGADYDLAGFCVSVAERDALIDGSAIRAGDVIIGLRSSGPHSNGFSLIRRVLEQQSITPDDGLLDTLLAPTHLYVRPVLAAMETAPVHGMAHITGGGLTENLPRVLPDGLGAEIELDSWERPDVFAWLQQAGNIDETEMLRTFNCGIGYVLIAAGSDAPRLRAALDAHGADSIEIGRVVSGVRYR